MSNNSDEVQVFVLTESGTSIEVLNNAHKYRDVS